MLTFLCTTYVPFLIFRLIYIYIVTVFVGLYIWLLGTVVPNAKACNHKYIASGSSSWDTSGRWRKLFIFLSKRAILKSRYKSNGEIKQTIKDGVIVLYCVHISVCLAVHARLQCCTVCTIAWKPSQSVNWY